MIRLRDIIYVILIIGSLFGICDTIFLISVDKEIILTPLRFVFLVISSALIYSLLFLIIGLSFTIFASLINALRYLKKPSFAISPGALLGALIFIVYLLTVGNIVNIKILPEKFSQTSIWGNVGILVFGFILWFIIYRIVLYYTSAIRTPRMFFYRLVGVISVLGLFIVILTVGTKYLNINIFKGEEKMRNNAILIVIETPDRTESKSVITSLEENIGLDNIIVLNNALLETTEKQDVMLSTLRSFQLSEKIIDEDFPNSANEPPPLSKYLEEKGFLTTAFISTENLIGNHYIYDGFSIYDDIFTFIGSLKRLTLFQNLEKLGFFSLYDDKSRDLERTFKDFNNWMRYQAKSSFFSMVHISISDEIGDPQRIADEIKGFQNIMTEKGIEDNTITLICFIPDEDIVEKNVIKPDDVMYPFVIISPKIVKKENLLSVISYLDIAPTIMDFLEVEIPDTMQGFSIIPIVSGYLPDRSIYLDGKALNISSYKDRFYINYEGSKSQFILDEAGQWVYMEEVPAPAEEATTLQ